MRVCLFSKFGNSSNLLYEGIRYGLEENRVDYLDLNISKEKKEETPHWISIPTITAKPPKTNDQLILDKISQFKPDVILLLQYSGLQFLLDNGNTIRQIIGKDGKIAFWLVDLAQKVNENKVLGQYLDFFFLSNAGQLNEYKQKWEIKNAFFMPQGCFIAKEEKSKTKFLHDVTFLGRRQRTDTRYRERNRILDVFKEKYNLFENEELLNINHMITFYQQSKISLGVSWKNDVALYSSDRIFNILGAGGFYLCQYFPGIEKLFKNHEHLVWFDSLDKGLQFASYYLSHDDERQKIAYNGYQLAKKKHTYKERIKNILDIVAHKNHQFSGYLTS